MLLFYVCNTMYICRLISFVEFQAFESLLCAPDAISQLSFKLFDINKSGKVSYGKNYIRTVVCSCIVGNFYAQWFVL